MSKREKHGRSMATYKTKQGLRCDVDELASLYLNVGNVPERLGWVKACEITCLAEAYLALRRHHKHCLEKLKGRKEK